MRGSLGDPQRAGASLYVGCLAMLFALSGCKALLYTPTPHVMPLFDGAGQVQAVAGLKYDSGFDLQVAGSPLPNTFLFASGSTTLRKRYEQRYGEVGGGLYIGLPHGVKLEALSGVGRGDAEGEGQRESSSPGPFPAFDTYRYTASYRRWFAQLNVATRARDGDLTVGAALRVSSVRYADFVTEPEGLVETVRGMYIEPALLLRARVNRYVDLEGQLGHSFSVGEENWALFERIRQYGNVGVRFHLGRP